MAIIFYTRQQQSLLERIERVAKIKFRKIGAPQPADIVKASARDIVISLKEVKDDVLPYFNEIAEEMINEEGAVKSLSKALAFISGNTKKISQRSILCAMEGFITYLVKSPVEFQAFGFIFSFLRKNASERLADSVKGIRKHGKLSAVFDVPEEFKGEMDRLIDDCKQNTKSSVRGYEVQVVDSMEMIEEGDDRPKRDGPENDEMDERDYREAMRNKKEWEIFIGSLPNNTDERELDDFFKEKGVRIANIRLLRSTYILM